MVVDRMLGKLGVEVTLVENGADAVDTYVASDFDLILMDLSMPVMGGLRQRAGSGATNRIAAAAPARSSL
jgi:CheY-like chemotaxis protein